MPHGQEMNRAEAHSMVMTIMKAPTTGGPREKVSTAAGRIPGLTAILTRIPEHKVTPGIRRMDRIIRRMRHTGRIGPIIQQMARQGDSINLTAGQALRRSRCPGG